MAVQRAHALRGGLSSLSRASLDAALPRVRELFTRGLSGTLSVGSVGGAVLSGRPSHAHRRAAGLLSLLVRSLGGRSHCASCAELADPPAVRPSSLFSYGFRTGKRFRGAPSRPSDWSFWCLRCHSGVLAPAERLVSALMFPGPSHRPLSAAWGSAQLSVAGSPAQDEFCHLQPVFLVCFTR